MLCENSLVKSRFQPDGLDSHSISNSAFLVVHLGSFFIYYIKVLFVILFASLALDALKMRPLLECLHL
jgi:hypothetical protein